MPHTGFNSIRTCSHLIFDEGGPNGPYSCDYIYIYDGVDTSETLLGTYFGSSVIPLVVSETGPLTILFSSDGSNNYAGFQLSVICLSKIRANFEKNNCLK